MAIRDTKPFAIALFKDDVATHVSIDALEVQRMDGESAFVLACG